ncbi:MAG TPA: metal ABC transporter substrate-binding protein [Oligoflexia bacterium]|nr:metal ABC transporter substrate-binding protein [Oligoflexia bacterium]HMR25261.1 metal ABC transporter substrate-binding protein [Oligoflexia bacterium]
MLKNLNINKVLIGVALCLLCALCFNTAQAKVLEIVTTTSTLEAIVKEITTKDQVTALVKGSQDAHYIQAKPSYIAKLRKADLLISIGLGLEDAWLDKIVTSARNLDLMQGKKGRLVAGQSVTPIEIPQGNITRAMGDVHPEGNPHILLDPLRVINVAKAIEKKLSLLNPQSSQYYQKNVLQFENKIQSNMKQWLAQLSLLQNKSVITYHTTLNYFLQRFGLEHAASIEPKPGIPPTAKHIQDLIAQIKQKKISCILMESIFDQTPANTIAQKTKMRVVNVAPEVGGLKKQSSYFSWMNDVVGAASNCLQAM